MSEVFKSWEELSRKEQLESIVWDAYKDAYGIRPRHMNLVAMTEQELDQELQFLGTVIDQQEQQRKLDEAAAVERFEKQIVAFIDAGAKDCETAIRWFHEAEETNGDPEYLCYCLGLPYGYFKVAA